MTETSGGESLPKPMYDDGWPRSARLHARALWDFHMALVNAETPRLDGHDLLAFFEAERESLLSGGSLKVVPEAITMGAYEAVETHGVPRALLGRQVLAARLFKGSIRFADGREVGAFIADWANAHGRALAHLAGATGSWQMQYVDEFSTALFWVGRLTTLKQDLERDWLFIPESDLAQAGVSVDDLRRGEVTEPVRRLLWKQTIRAKDAFAQSEQLAMDLSRRPASAVKRWWIAGLEILNEIRRRDYDVWSEPVDLSTFYRLQVRLQARFGRTTFRSK